jgi:hypothetical protein
LVPKTPLAFASIAGGVNHWPGIMLNFYKDHGMTSTMDEKTKTKYAEACHLKLSIKRQTGRIVSIEDIFENPLQFRKPEFVGRWNGWCNRCRAIFNCVENNDVNISDWRKYSN